MKRILNFVFPILMVVFGVIAIVSGAGKLASKDLYDLPLTATISDIQREWRGVDEDGFEEYDYYVFVDYEVNGQKYEHVQYPNYANTMKVGDSVEILCQSQNPEKIVEKNVTGNSVIFIVIGGVLILAGIGLGIKAIVRP